MRHLKVSNVEREVHRDRVAKVRTRLEKLGIPYVPSPSHIVPVMVGDAAKCKWISDILLDSYGVYVQPINYRTVPRRTERLRITPSPLHTDADIDHLIQALSDLWSQCALARAVARQDRPHGRGLYDSLRVSDTLIVRWVNRLGHFPSGQSLEPQGIWSAMFEALTGSTGVIGTAAIDASHVKAHHSAAGGKGGSSKRPSDDRAAREGPPEIELLFGPVARDARREPNTQSAPNLGALRPRLDFCHVEPRHCREEGRRQVGPSRVPIEICYLDDIPRRRAPRTPVM